MNTDNQRHNDLVSLCGQIVNGMMSSDSSVWMKALDRTTPQYLADYTTTLADAILNKIEKMEIERQ